MPYHHLLNHEICSNITVSCYQGGNMKTLLEKYNVDISKDSIWIHATPSDVAKSTFYYVQEAGRFICRPNYYTERENLDSFLILFTISGSGKLEYKGENYSISPGQAFFIDCINHHRYCETSFNIWDISWIHFKGANARNYHELFQKYCPPVVNVLNPEYFQQTIFNIIDKHKNFTADSELICSNQINTLLTELLRSVNSILFQAASMPDYIQSIITTLEKNYAINISLDELSTAYSISKYHLEREFRKYIGISVHEYHIRIRINLAKDLLTSTKLPISDIAQMVGIENVSHFINLFKNRVYETPTAYRKQWRNLN
jgi:AraC-like DNA-binding protein